MNSSGRTRKTRENSGRGHGRGLHDASAGTVPATVLEAMRGNLRDREFVLRLEAEFRDLVDKKRQQCSFPAMNSYYRFLIHEMATVFQLKSESSGTGDDRHTIVTTTTKAAKPSFRLEGLGADGSGSGGGRSGSARSSGSSRTRSTKRSSKKGTSSSPAPDAGTSQPAQAQPAKGRGSKAAVSAPATAPAVVTPATCPSPKALAAASATPAPSAVVVVASAAPSAAVRTNGVGAVVDADAVLTAPADDSPTPVAELVLTAPVSPAGASGAVERTKAPGPTRSPAAPPLADVVLGDSGANPAASPDGGAGTTSAGAGGSGSDSDSDDLDGLIPVLEVVSVRTSASPPPPPPVAQPTAAPRVRGRGATSATATSVIQQEAPQQVARADTSNADADWLSERADSGAGNAPTQDYSRFSRVLGAPPPPNPATGPSSARRTDHLVEVYNLPAGLQRHHVCALIASQTKLSVDEFDVQPVDRSTMLVSFSGASAAQRAITIVKHPVIRLRPMSFGVIAAMRELPAPVKPKRTTAVARRLIGRALGTRLPKEGSGRDATGAAASRPDRDDSGSAVPAAAPAPRVVRGRGARGSSSSLRSESDDRLGARSRDSDDRFASRGRDSDDRFGTRRRDSDDGFGSRSRGSDDRFGSRSRDSDDRFGARRRDSDDRFGSRGSRRCDGDDWYR